MPIRILAPTVAAQIAAGEVIEHPASVVKEMVENALDAGAGRITVEARGGGLQEIKIQDDGCGIPADEIPLAFHRHATSKLQQTDDLWNIATLGFRGEALPSIASVSQMVCITRTEDEDVGTEFRIAGGEIQSCTPRGCARGTSMSIRNLFYNTPVRRDYLRSDASEMANISTIVQQYALAYPSVRFTLLLDGRLALQTSGQGNMRDVLIEIYGLETARHLLPIEAEYGMDEDEITVRGLISPPGQTRASRNAIHLFVNLRALQSRGPLVYALEEAYHTLLMKGKYPIAVIDIRIHPSAVDVNIHPTKSEVRFRHPSRVNSLLGRAVRQALLEHAGVPSWNDLIASRQAAAGTQFSASASTESPEIRQINLHQQPQELSSETAWGVGKRAWNVQFSRWDVGNPPPPSPPAREPEEPGQRNTQSQYYGQEQNNYARDQDHEHDHRENGKSHHIRHKTENNTEYDNDNDTVRNDNTFGDAVDVVNDVIPDTRNQGRSDAMSTPRPARVAEAEEATGPGSVPEPVPPPRHSNLPLLRLVGQVGLTYMVAESPDGMYLIDQHAAHERISYERLIAQYQHGQVETQELLIPQTINIPPASAETLLAHQDTLEAWGFGIETWGEGMVRVRKVPAVLLQENLQAALLEVADSLGDEGGNTPDSWREAMLTTLACHTSVRAGQTLSLDEMRKMLRQLEQCTNPLTCPHGRPIMILLTPGQLERQFGRA